MPDWSNLPGLVNTENWIAALPQAVRQDIHDRMTTRVLAAGETLKSIGAPPSGIYQVEAGYLRLIAELADGGQTLVVIYMPGNCFSESTLVARRPSNHTSIAMTPARVRWLSTDDFWALYHRHPEIPEALCRKFANSMTRLLIRREMVATRRLRDMVALVFCNLADHCGRQDVSGEVTIELPLTQHDVADHLGVTRQAVQREIGALKKLGIVAKRDGFWRVLDPPALLRIIPAD